MTSTKRIPQLSGTAGVAQSLRYMRQYVNDYKTNIHVREKALELTRHLLQKDFKGEVRALWDFVKFNIRYVRDINDVETLQSPLKTLEYGAGDCDDKSSLLATLLESIGFKTRFRAVGTGKTLCHVLTDVYINGKWIALETTEPVALGWTPPNMTNTLEG